MELDRKNPYSRVQETATYFNENHYPGSLEFQLHTTNLLLCELIQKVAQGNDTFITLEDEIKKYNAQQIKHELSGSSAR